jgi:predicted TIM-barrel fold metal-dependent hydrolase
MGRIVDSEAHAWTRLPVNWRHRSSPDEKRSPLGPRAAANYKPSRPKLDGSFFPPEDNSDDLLTMMDMFGVDISVIYPGACMCPAAEVKRVMDRAPKRLIGFSKFGKHVPPYGTAKQAQAAADEVEHGLRDLGIRGVGELSCEHFEPLTAEEAVNGMKPWFEICAKYGAPAIVHAHAGGGAHNVSYCDPANFEPLVHDFPKAVLILNHMGGSRREFFDHALALAKKYDNVHFNTSQTLPEHLSEAVKKVGAERIHFGTDWYALEHPESRERSQHGNQMRIVERATMSDRERELVMGESLAQLLGI